MIHAILILTAVTIMDGDTIRSGDLLLPLGPAEKTAGERASDVIDLINRRYGADTIRHGVHLPHPVFFERG
jgi:DNA polymerase-4